MLYAFQAHTSYHLIASSMYKQCSNMLVTDYSPSSGLCSTGFTSATSKTVQLSTHTSNAT